MGNTLTVTGTHDYSGEAISETDTISFDLGDHQTAIATFTASQFGPGLISNSVQVFFGAGAPSITVNLGAATSFSAAGWQFPNEGSQGGVEINGSAHDDTITGSSRGDGIDGGAGNDTLAGGPGDDAYYLHDVHKVDVGVSQQAGGSTATVDVYAYDKVIENPGEGSDTVWITPVPNGTTYTLPANVDVGIVDSSGAPGFVLNGNDAPNSLYIGLGYSGETLNGAGGDDYLYDGSGGASTLIGGAGSDVLDGAVNVNPSIHDIWIGGPDGDYFRLDYSPGAEITDFDRGNLDFYSSAEYDQLIVPITSGAQGQPFNVARVVEDPTNAHVLVQGDDDGIANGVSWAFLGQLDSLHAGDGVNIRAAEGGLSIGVPLGTFYPLTDAGHFGDLSGDGKADLVWRNDDGTVATWQMDGGAVPTGNFLPGVSSDWHVLGTDDFSGDGVTDILWLNDNGNLLYWQMTNASTIGSTPSLGVAPANSELIGIGDVDGDHKADLFWRDLTTGTITLTTIAGAYSQLTGIGNDWSVVGVGDYNGDGIADIMFRNIYQNINATRLMDGINFDATVFYPGVPNEWHVEATGDFNGDNNADVFWHNDSGANAIWLMNGGAGLASTVFLPGVSTDWHVAGTGDFNGDFKDDIVWRNDSGATSVWLMNGTDTPTVTFPGGVPNEWATQAHHYDYV